MNSRSQTALWTALSVVFVTVSGCHNGLATLSSSGVPAITGSGGATVTGGPTNYTVDFGQVAVGDQGQATLSLENSGSSPLLITSVGAPSDPEFTLGLASGTRIEVGASIPVACTFKPFSAGKKTATLVLNTDSQSIPTVTLELQGEGVAVTLVVEPRVLDFGTVVIHSALTKSITLTNQSALALTVTPSAIGGTNATLFTSTAGTAALTLPPNQSVTMPFTYQPVVPSKLDVATLTFTPSIGAAIPVSLQAVGAETGLSISPNPVDFSFVQPGNVATVTLRIRNVGNEQVNVTQVAITDPGGGAFAIAPGTVTQATPLVAGSELDIPLQFSPTYLQHYQGEISITSNDNLGLQLVTLQGWGGGAGIRCTPLALDFGFVAIGISPSLPVLCTNTGSEIPNHPEADLVIGRLRTSDPAFSAAVDANSLTTLQAGQTALINVSYQPPAPDQDSATLTVLSNVTSAPAPVIALSGEGIEVGPCSYTIVPGSLDWGAVSGADKSLEHTQAVTITNVGPNLCVVDALRLSDSDTGAFTLPMGAINSQLLAAPGMPQMVDGGVLPTSMSVPVSFAALRGQGSYAGQLIFTISDPNAPSQVVNLAAQAVDSCFLLQPDQLNLGAAGFTGNGQFCQKNHRQFVGTNECAGDVTITGVTLGEGEPFEQIGVPTLPLVVPPGTSSAPFVYGFVPNAVGTYYGAVKVQTDLLSTPLGATLQGTAIEGTQQTDVFQGTSTSAVDILWVVDSDDLQAELEFPTAPPTPLDKLSQFVAAAQGVDYQMAVLTDDCPNFDDGNFEPCPTCFNTGSTATIITPALSDPGTALTDLIAQVAKTGGSGSCSGNYNATMQAAWDALQPNMLSGHNAGFLRDGASLAIVVYDPDGYAEDEGSPQKPDYYLNFFRSLKGGNAQLVTVNLMYLGVYGPYPWGPRYPALTTAAGGLLLDTSVTGWNADVTKLWNNISNGEGGFTLSGTPIPSTLQVWLDGPPPGPGVTVPGLQIAQENPNGSWNWSYAPTTNTIVLNGQNYNLGSTDTVTVVYSLACE